MEFGNIILTLSVLVFIVTMVMIVKISKTELDV